MTSAIHINHARYDDASAQELSEDGWQMQYRQIGRGRFEGSVCHLVAGPVTLSRERINVAIAQDTETPGRSTSLIFPLAAEGGWRVNGHLERRKITAVRRGRTALHAVIGPESDLLAVTIDGHGLPEGLVADGIYTRERDPSTAAALDWLLSLIDTATHAPAALSGAGPLLGELLVDRLAELVASHAGKAGARQSPGESFRLFRRASAICADLMGEPLSLQRLSGLADVTPEQLRLAFQAATGTSPVAWLRLRRLDGARRALLRAKGGEASVSDIAMTWGFYHLGRFSAVYRHHFGESPRATLQRSRASKPLAALMATKID